MRTSCRNAWIYIGNSNGAMNLNLNRENHRLFLERIRKVIAGAFLSGRGWFHLGRLLAHPTHRISPPSPEFLNLPGRVGDEAQLDSFLFRPVLFLNPVFDFGVD